MKILAISDIHNDLYRTKKLKEVVATENPDAIVVAGDITNFGPTSMASEILKELESMGKRVLAVTGNGDPEGVEDILEKGNMSLHSKPLKVKNVGFTGFGVPSIAKLGELLIMNYDSLENDFKEISKCEQKVLVSHFPPQNTKVDEIFSGEHIGSEVLRDLIADKKPDLVICGHIHEARGTDKIGKTLVVNPGALCEGYAALIELGKGEPKTRFIPVGKP